MPKSHLFTLCLMAFVLLLFSPFGITLAVPESNTPVTVASQVLTALKNHDGARLASLVHPVKGVRFSPYGYVLPKGDVVLKKDAISKLWTSPVRRKWGEADGTGDPILMTGKKYVGRYVFDYDFTRLKPGKNPDRTIGNTPNNAAKVYPKSERIEYYFPGTKAHDGMDWKALRVVLEQQGKSWYLVGLIHDEWTI